MGGRPWLSPNKTKTRVPMQAVRFLHEAFAQALPSVHAKRLITLMCVVSALLAGRRLTLTVVGRFMPGGGQPRHAIKRADRLLANPHLQTERPLFYLMMMRALLGALKHPLVLVDWSPVDAPRLLLLVAGRDTAGWALLCHLRARVTPCPYSHTFGGPRSSLASDEKWRPLGRPFSSWEEVRFSIVPYYSALLLRPVMTYNTSKPSL